MVVSTLMSNLLTLAFNTNYFFVQTSTSQKLLRQNFRKIQRNYKRFAYRVLIVHKPTDIVVISEVVFIT